MARKSVIYGEYIITCEDGKEIHVTQIFDKEYDETWNTQTLGSKLIDFIETGR